MNAQDLFDRFNRKYWKGRLAHYTVLVSDKFGGGICKKKQRTIYINPVVSGGIPRTLLHEMAHAAAKGIGHGEPWLREIKRLVRLGALPKSEKCGVNGYGAVGKGGATKKREPPLTLE